LNQSRAKIPSPIKPKEGISQRLSVLPSRSSPIQATVLIQPVKVSSPPRKLGVDGRKSFNYFHLIAARNCCQDSNATKIPVAIIDVFQDMIDNSGW